MKITKIVILLLVVFAMVTSLRHGGNPHHNSPKCPDYEKLCGKDKIKKYCEYWLKLCGIHCPFREHICQMTKNKEACDEVKGPNCGQAYKVATEMGVGL